MDTFETPVGDSEPEEASGVCRTCGHIVARPPEDLPVPEPF